MLAWTLSGELKTDAVTASVLPPVDPEDSVDPEDPVDAEDEGWEGVVKDGDSSDELERISDKLERISDELERISDDVDRISDEDERVSDEDERISDEVESISDEDERISDEDEGISDEVETGERLFAGFVLDVLIVVGPDKIFRFSWGNFQLRIRFRKMWARV